MEFPCGSRSITKIFLPCWDKAEARLWALQDRKKALLKKLDRISDEGGKIPANDPAYRELSFINGVQPLSLQQAHEKGYVNDNVVEKITLLISD